VSAIERVYTMTDYYDGPRAGIADFHGVAHRYLSVPYAPEVEPALAATAWDPTDTRFYLQPVTPAVLRWALEAWAIWERFDAARREGHLAEPMPEERWGALPADSARRAELETWLAPALRLDRAHCFVARATFHRRAPVPTEPGDGGLQTLGVAWEAVARVV
jgi:hypothetical protein